MKKYNWICEKPELGKGEEYCDKCGGDCFIEIGGGELLFCERCQGTGKLDWIEKICGKKPNFSSMDSTFNLYNIYFFTKSRSNGEECFKFMHMDDTVK